MKNLRITQLSMNATLLDSQTHKMTEIYTEADRSVGHYRGQRMDRWMDESIAG